MSISSALNAAVSGLTAASRSAEVVASNVSNALTEGYGRREISLQARSLGGTGQGVVVVGVDRRVDHVLITDRRQAQAGSGARDVRADFMQMLEKVIGTPESEGSLGARVAAFDSALIVAASRPESGVRLTEVADAARGLTTALAEATSQVQTARASADRRIATEVSMLNKALAQVADLNGVIRKQAGSERDVSALLDQRQQVIDSIAALVPLREVDRGDGQVSLFAQSGAVLLEGKPSLLEFSPAGVVVPQMSVQTGGLSQLMLNGRPVPMTGAGGSIAGGSLAALFTLRDETAVAAQAQLDGVARDLISRFADPAVDPTLAPGAAGLFTDDGAAFAPANEVGLAGRLALNAAVDPREGGAVWRLRDGIAATTPGASGQSALLTALGEALNVSRPIVSGGFLPGNRSFGTLVSDLLSGVASDRLNAESEASFSQARYSALKDLELQGGVDTDQELQSLMAIEQSYAANAKVIQSVDQMIQTLLGL